MSLIFSKMKLRDVVLQLELLDDEQTIYARTPWSCDSEVELIGENPIEETKVKNSGFQYFIEVWLAREFLEEWRANVVKKPTNQQCCERLIQYAENDA